MNVNKVLIKDYENIANCEPCENEPKTNPIYPCVASGEVGSNPIYPVVASGEAGSKPIQSQFQRQKTLLRLTIIRFGVKIDFSINDIIIPVLFHLC